MKENKKIGLLKTIAIPVMLALLLNQNIIAARALPEEEVEATPEIVGQEGISNEDSDGIRTADPAIEEENNFESSNFLEDFSLLETASGTEEIISETASGTEEIISETASTESLATSSESITDSVREPDENSGRQNLEAGELPGDFGTSTQTVIETGDSEIASAIENKTNTNIASSAGTEIIVGNDNDASTTNDLALYGESGGNAIASSSGFAKIETGDVSIMSAIINYINTNFFGKGKNFFINIFDQLAGNIDLSGHGDEPQGQDAGGKDIVINIGNDNDSSLDNNIIIDASTGSNLISQSGGTSIIETGDINIINDIVNINNLNISGDDWYFAVVNIFGLLEGDIILPGLPESESEMMLMAEEAEKKSTGNAEIIIANKNNADMLNNIAINAETGENTITGSGTPVIKTGDAEVKMTAFNLINANYTGDHWRFAKVNIFGNWRGIVENLPPGYGYFEDENGITIYNEYFDPKAFIDSFAKLMVENTNNAAVNNSITINANTGGNSILHGDGSISTGDISIKNSLLNFINSNFTGQGWEFSMINVFGEWQGNLSFGRPDLWVTQSADNQDGELKKGDLITYTFLFGNSGDSGASGAKIIDDYDERYFEPAGLGDDSGRMVMDLGTIPPNSQGSASYTLKVKDSIPFGQNQAENAARISSVESDRDYGNNISGGRVVLNGGIMGSPGVSLASSYASSLPGLAIIKTNNAGSAVVPGETVDYEVLIENTGGSDLTDVLIADTLYASETGEEITGDIWDLETLSAGEKVVITYSIKITGTMPGGTYVNEALAEGYDEIRGRYISAIASSKIKVENEAVSADPQIVISAGVTGKTLYPGNEEQMDIVVANNGRGNAYDVRLEAELPEGMVFSDTGRAKFSSEFGLMPPGEIVSFSKRVKVSERLNPGVYASVINAESGNAGRQKIVFDLKISQLAAESVNMGSGNGAAGSVIRSSLRTEEETEYVEEETEENIEVLSIGSDGHEPDGKEILSFADSNPREALAASKEGFMDIVKTLNWGDMALFLTTLLLTASLYFGMRRLRDIL